MIEFHNIGFTGTSLVTTTKQDAALFKLLSVLGARDRNVHSGHHGDCIGADFTFHNAVWQYIPRARIVIHPPTDRKARAFCRIRGIASGDEIKRSYAFLTRNRHIVAASDLLIACPFTHNEQLRSGTWSTIRYARQKPIPIIKIIPDGNYSAEGDVGDLLDFARQI